MRNLIQAGAAVLVIVASLAFVTIGVARAATGFPWHPQPRQGISLLSGPGDTLTPTPTQMVEPSETPEPTHISETETPDTDDDSMEESSDKSGQSEMENDDSNEMDDESGGQFSAPQTYHHHSGSGGSTSSGEDDGGD